MTARILYIEDNPQNMRLVRKMLTLGGYDMLEATDGHTGVQMAIEQKPDLILMDINLPDIDGIQATRTIKDTEQTAHIPVIALTANAMHGDREMFLEAGCDGYLAKPVTRNELLNTVSYFLDHRRPDLLSSKEEDIAWRSSSS
ncbi:MAG: response regulator [Anaerolineaceae bacterium]|nr:MAG: response regulator [Anaerolineaceae bacterium]